MKGRRLWAIVLAGGEGSRLAEATQRVYGSRLPKQFLNFGQKRTFLQATVDRLLGLVPADRTIVVVPERHQDVAIEQLRGFSGIEIVTQPRNLGTGPGILLPLLHVLKRDPRADVALVPSDHHFRAPGAALLALARAQRAASGASMVLLGCMADGPAVDLGWIVPRRVRDARRVSAIERFVEKPPAPLADELFRRGALWNTMLSVSRADALWALSERHLPVQCAQFAEYFPWLGGSDADERLRRLYERLAPADFSRDLVAPAGGLRVAPLADSGWSDCGTPERLEAAFGGTVHLAKAASAFSRMITGARA
jgi:mannose-1-phosphate guanylyltransferase